jgi:hypothetical protein
MAIFAVRFRRCARSTRFRTTCRGTRRASSVERFKSQRLIAHFDATNLLTLTGAGGCGKSRLALQVATSLLDTYPDGAWLVELAALADPSFVPHTVANVLGIVGEAG